MKKQFILIIMAVCLLAACAGGSVTASALAPSFDDLRSLTVTGTATLTVQADGLEFYGNSSSVAGTLAEAEESSLAAYRKICVAFAPYGEVIERSYNVIPTHKGNGYTACRYLQFKANSADKTADIRRELTDAGVTEICGMCYTSSGDADHRANVLALALENAQSTAEAMGAEGSLVKAEEIYCYPDGSAVGTITYTASVRAHFRRLPEPRNDSSDNATTGENVQNENNFTIKN